MKSKSTVASPAPDSDVVQNCLAALDRSVVSVDLDAHGCAVIGPLSACRTASEIHEGMTWGAVAKKRTTATGLDEQTLSNRPTSCSTCPETLDPSAS
jgi:hypothetical protein